MKDHMLIVIAVIGVVLAISSITDLSFTIVNKSKLERNYQTTKTFRADVLQWRDQFAKDNPHLKIPDNPSSIEIQPK